MYTIFPIECPYCNNKMPIWFQVGDAYTNEDGITVQVHKCSFCAGQIDIKSNNLPIVGNNPVVVEEKIVDAVNDRSAKVNIGTDDVLPSVNIVPNPIDIRKEEPRTNDVFIVRKAENSSQHKVNIEEKPKIIDQTPKININKPDKSNKKESKPVEIKNAPQKENKNKGRYFLYGGIFIAILIVFIVAGAITNKNREISMRNNQIEMNERKIAENNKIIDELERKGRVYDNFTSAYSKYNSGLISDSMLSEYAYDVMSEYNVEDGHLLVFQGKYDSFVRKASYARRDDLEKIVRLSEENMRLAGENMELKGY